MQTMKGFASALILVVAAALFVAVRVSSGSGSGGNEPGTIDVAGYRLYPSPARLNAQCVRVKRHVRFIVLCPTLMPRSGDGVTAATASSLPPGDAGIAPMTFAQWGGFPANVVASWLYVGGTYGGGETDPQDWNSNNPNYFFHFFVDEGKLTSEQMSLGGPGTPQQFLGRRVLAGHTGTLWTQVSYSRCKGACSFTGHLTFIWHQHDVTYAASLHRWSPEALNKSVLAILEALIAHLGPV
jgi:hypothetical protein